MKPLFLLCLPLIVLPVVARPLAKTNDQQHSQWPKYCSDYSNTGVAESGGVISTSTVQELSLSWSVTLGGPIASSPTITNETIYVGDWSGFESAIDITNGNVLAMADLGTTLAPQCVPSAMGITSAPTSTGDTISLAGGDNYFYALDAVTLQATWSRMMGDNSASGGYYGWCSPTYVGGRLLQGVSSNCDNPFVQGALVALDAASGKVMSTSYTVVPDWPHNAIGAGIWTSPAVDLTARKVFVTTASALSLDDGHNDSILRMSLDDLSIEDSWQAVSGIDDADWGSSPTLFTDANGQQLVGAGEKDGNYYVFRRDDLGSGPVWVTQLAVGGDCPLCGSGVLSTAAFDGNALYVGSGRAVGQGSGLGAFTALDPTTGNVLWQVAVSDPVIAPMSYTNGVAFGVSGSHVYALQAATGTILWTRETKAMCVGGVAITDRGIFFGDMSGTLYAYSVPPTQTVRKRAVRP